MSSTRHNEIFLHPGEYAVADASCRLATLLGSCVAITLWHPARRIGAMSHFLLPSQGRKERAPPNGRYGDEALELMLAALGGLLVPAAECQARIFGGANMFPERSLSEQRGVGETNGLAARRLLQAHRIPLMSESLFGTEHRRIVFDIRNGEVWERRGRRLDLAAEGSVA
jgi:chemotaxis protein CheD